MKRAIFLLPCVMLAVSACQTSEVLDPSGSPASPSPTTSSSSTPAGVSKLVASRCAVYFAIEDQLEAEGRPANGTIYEGCPPGTSVGADIKPMNPAPDTSSSTARTLYRELIKRGTPKDVADQVVKSRAFQDWLKAAG